MNLVELRELGEETKALYKPDWAMKDGILYHDKIDGLVSEAGNQIKDLSNISAISEKMVCERFGARIEIFNSARKVKRAAKLNR